MRQIVASRTLAIPDEVEFSVKSRRVHVKGPRGASSLQRTGRSGGRRWVMGRAWAGLPAA